MLAIFLNFYTSKELADQLKKIFYKAIEGLLHDRRKFQLKWCNMLVIFLKTFIALSQQRAC